jgi:fimbrial isopeptide formation D2 family protein/uncharacterized repeat protein (TIGR01451 family)
VIIATLALSFAFMLNSPSAKAALPAPGGVDTGLELWLKADAATVVGSGITNWDDSTGQHSDEQIINGPIPYTVSAYNFNPTARFQNKYMRWLSQQLLSGATAGENFFVLRTLALPGQHSGYPSEFGGGGTGAGWGYHVTTNNIRNGWGSTSIKNWDPAAAPAGGPARDLMALHIYNELSAPGNYTARFDGVTNFTTNSNTVNFNSSTSSHTYVGASHNSVFNGDISEFMVYRRELTAAERSRVQSYNAIKYGITLGTTTSPISYVASNGSTTFWNADATYQNNVFGIGRDDNSALSQKQSRSENAGGLVTIAQGTIAASNAANTNSFSANNSFLMTGDNNGAVNTWTTTGIPGLDTLQYKRIARTWKVQKTGTVAPMTVSFNVNNPNADIVPATNGYYLLNLTTGAATPLTSADGSNYSASGINFNNGDLYTLGTSQATYNVHFKKTVSPVATSITPGQTFTYTVTAENLGNVPQTGLSFFDDLTNVIDDATYNSDVATTAGSATFNSGNNHIEWSGSLGAGQSATITYSLTMNQPDTGDGRLDNGVVASGTGVNCTENPAVDPDCLTTTPLPVIASQKTLISPANPEAGDTMNYQFVITNQGGAAATTVPVADDLSEVLDDAVYNDDAAASSGSLSYNPLTKRLSWSGSLAANGNAGDSVTVTYSVTVNAASALGDAVLNNAVVSPDCPSTPIFDTSDPNYDANCVTSTSISAWTARKIILPTSDINPGDTVTYTVEVENTGAVNLTSLSLEDDMTGVLDDATYNNDVNATSGTPTFTSPTLTWNGNLTSGQTATVTYSATVKSEGSLGDRTLANAIGAGPMNCPATPTTNPGDPNFNTACAVLSSITIPASPTTDPTSGSGGTGGLANTGDNIMPILATAFMLMVSGSIILVKKSKPKVKNS